MLTEKSMAVLVSLFFVLLCCCVLGCGAEPGSRLAGGPSGIDFTTLTGRFVRTQAADTDEIAWVRFLDATPDEAHQRVEGAFEMAHLAHGGWENQQGRYTALSVNPLNGKPTLLLGSPSLEGTVTVYFVERARYRDGALAAFEAHRVQEGVEGQGFALVRTAR